MLASSGAAPLDVALLEGRQPALRILPDRFDEREVGAAGRRPRSWTRLLYSRQLGTSGTRSMPNVPPRREDARDRIERRRQIASAG